MLTFGLCGLGYIYDMWTLNDQLTLINGQSGGNRTLRSA